MDDRDVATMSDSELLSALDTTHEDMSVLQTRQTQILDRLEQTGYAKTIGAHDLPRLLSARYRLDLADATRRVKYAIALRKYPGVAAALPTPGQVTPEHGVVLHPAQARAIMAALDQIPKSANVPVEDLDAAAEQMVHAARHMKPDELRSLGVQVRNILDTDGPEPRENAARAREEVWITKAEDGVKFGGYLAAENAEKLQTVLQAGAKPHKTPDGALDPRSRGKRQADALVDCLDITLKSGSLPTRGGIKPHIAVTINLNDLLEAGRQATGDLTYGDGLSASAIRRLACDAGIIPIVLGSDSRLLDVGREFRFVTDGLRNALNRRDKGCVICHAPPIYCDAHHIVSWFDGGVTSLANLVLLCRVDHNSLHDGHWTITITNNQVHVTRPTWADPPARTGRRIPSPSTAPATTPATTDAEPWPPPTGTGTAPATPDCDPWAPSTGTGAASATTEADPWPPSTGMGAASATTEADPWPPPAGTGAAPAAADADPWPPSTSTGDADPWPPSTGTGAAPATSDGEPWPPSTGTDAGPAAADGEPWPPSTGTDAEPAAVDGELWPPPTGTEAAPPTPDADPSPPSTATGDADPWPPPSGTGTAPAAADTELWPPPSGTEVATATPDADSSPPSTTTGDADPWPPPSGTGTAPTAADAELWPAPSGTGATPSTVDADPWPPSHTTGDVDPWPLSTGTGTAPATEGDESWPPSTITDRAPAAAGSGSWSPSTGTGAASAASDGDLWSAPTTTDGTPSAADVAASAQVSVGEEAGVSADTSSAVGLGLRWPYNDDAAWITAEESAALDPWGDNPASGATAPSRPAPTTTPTRNKSRIDAPWTTPEEAAALNPWGDSPAGAATAPAAGAPWGDNPAGAATGPAAGAAATSGGDWAQDEGDWATPEGLASLDPWADSA